jgi:hypothetical protein
VSYQAVQNWYASRIPLQHCATMETLMRGALQCEQLRDEYRLRNERPYRKAHNIYCAGDEPCIYVAGPMTVYPELNHPAFHAEAARLRPAVLNVVSPTEVTLDGEPPLMRADLRLMMRRSCCRACADRAARASGMAYEAHRPDEAQRARDGEVVAADQRRQAARRQCVQAAPRAQQRDPRLGARRRLHPRLPLL